MIAQEPLDDQYPPASSAASQLFTVRVWVESAHDESRQVRVQVKHVLSGVTRTFREWTQVVAFITAKLQVSETDQAAKGDQPEPFVAAPGQAHNGASDAGRQNRWGI